MTTTAPPTPNLNHAAAALIEALDSVTNLAGFRDGLSTQAAFWGTFADPADPSHRDAIDLLAVWRALDDLAAAVQVRKESHDG